MVKLNIAELLRSPDMVHHYRVHEALPSTSDLDYASTVVGYLDFRRTSNMLIIRGELEAAARMECVRCLDELIAPIHADVVEQFTVENMRIVASADDEEGRGSAADLFRDHDLILDEFIRQHLLLERPEYPLCAPDCKGLCPHCGSDLNNSNCHCEGPPSDNRLARLVELYGDPRN